MSATTTVERAELREMAQELARRELGPCARELDAAEPSTLRRCWRALSAAGLDRALLSEADGGPGLDVADLLAVLEELATGEAGMALNVLLSNAALALLPAARLALVPEGARWALVPVRAGEELTLGGGALDGHVGSALGAYEADGLVLAVHGDGAEVIALEPGLPGLALERDEAQMGLCGAPAAALGIAVARAEVTWIGDDGERSAAGDRAGEVARARALLRAGTGAIARGITRRAYELARDYAHERRQGGVPIVAHDAVADMLAAMTVRLSCPPPAATTAAHALAIKIAATDAAVLSTIDAVQVFGGTGYMRETGVEKLMRDAKYCQLFPEPNWLAQDELVHLQHSPERDLPVLASLLAGPGP